MTYLLISIFILTVVLYFVRKTSDLNICPICIATVFTWSWAFIAVAFKLLDIPPVLISLLMAISLGATVQKYGSKLGLLWKTICVLVGLPAVYLVSQGAFLKALLFGLALFLFTVLSFIFTKEKNINDKFEECC
ncbi:MAG: hypothetical protein ACYC5G_02650 [Candidatus Doudnabacteria bacterium]